MLGGNGPLLAFEIQLIIHICGCPSKLVDKLIDQAVTEVASKLVEFCENLVNHMYSTKFVI